MLRSMSGSIGLAGFSRIFGPSRALFFSSSSSSDSSDKKSKPTRVSRRSKRGMENEEGEQKKEKDEEEIGIDIEEDVGPAPEKPLPGDCCGSGCERCVWDIYFDEVDEYNKRKKRIEDAKLKKPS